MPLPTSTPPPAIAQAPAAAWGLSAERLLAADSGAYAPPDLKRMMARHASRLMKGVTDAVTADRGTRDRAARLAAAARGAQAVALSIRERTPFSDVVYELGGLIHEVARAFPPPAAPPRTSTFLGFTPRPFDAPEALVREPLPADGSYDAAVTVATRLLAWTWKAAGGRATVTSEYPATKGPYVVR